jgi:hypothetical protein
MIYNDDYYKQSGGIFFGDGNPSNLIDLYQKENALIIKIVGILRAKKNSVEALRA